MVDVSATVLTLNEEENIRECLETLTWCDEIIVVDSYSDDATVEIANEYTDKIYNHERTGYSEPARKKAVEKASGDWICMVDADERLSDSLIKELKELIEEGSSDVIYAPRKNYILGQWIDCAGWWPDYRPVLYKTETAELSSTIHEFISFPNSSNKTYLDKKDRNSIIHFNYTDINDFISRTNKYTSVEGKQKEFKYWKIIILPLYEFTKRFVYLKGYRRGMVGFLLAVFMSWYRFLTMAKSWQYKNIGKKENINKKYKKEFGK